VHTAGGGKYSKALEKIISNNYTTDKTCLKQQ
jgi:hypothetical protein